MNEGWKCPGCGSCYAPHIDKCPDCGNQGTAGVHARPTPTAPWINGGQVMQRCPRCGDSYTYGQPHTCTHANTTNSSFMNQPIGFRIGEDEPEAVVFSDGALVVGERNITSNLADALLAEINNRMARS